MKYILFILLFIGCRGQSQVLLSEESSSTSTTNATSYTIAASYNSGDLFIVFVASTFSTTPVTPTLVNSDFTFSQIATHTNSTNRITVFSALATAGGATNITADFGAETETSFSHYMFRITGYDVTTQILQSVTGGTTGANPSITMSAIGSARNAVVAVFVSNTNPLTGTAGGAFSERFDLGGINPTRGWYGMYDIATTDNVPTVTAGSSDWAGIAIEIQSAPARRRISID